MSAKHIMYITYMRVIHSNTYFTSTYVHTVLTQACALLCGASNTHDTKWNSPCGRYAPATYTNANIIWVCFLCFCAKAAVSMPFLCVRAHKVQRAMRCRSWCCCRCCCWLVRKAIFIMDIMVAWPFSNDDVKYDLFLLEIARRLDWSLECVLRCVVCACLCAETLLRNRDTMRREWETLPMPSKSNAS